MEMSEDLFLQIRTLIVEQCGCDKTEVSRTTKLEKDLGVTGDDGVELMDAFFDRFRIDAESFNYSNHFHSEGFGIFFCLFTSRRPKIRDLKVEDLIYMASNRHCSLPEIN